MLRVPGTVDLAEWANISLTMDMDMSKVMVFEACFLVMRMIVKEGGINRYAMDGPGGVDFVAEFCVLESQLGLRREWRGGCRGERLWIGRHGHFFDISFYIINKLRHLQLIKGREWIFFNFSLDGTESVASTTDAGQGGGEVEDGFQTLVLEIDTGDAPQRGAGFEVKF